MDVLVCRLGRVRLSRGKAGAVAVLRGISGTAGEVFPFPLPLAAVGGAVAGDALKGICISVVRRGRLSGVIGEEEGWPM